MFSFYFCLQLEEGKIKWLEEKHHEPTNKQGFDGINKGESQTRVLAKL